MKVKPLEDRILIEELQERIEEGIVIRDSSKKNPLYGKVIAVGNGRITEEGKTIPMRVKIGDTILYPYYAGMYVQIDNKEYLLIRGDEALAIIGQ